MPYRHVSALLPLLARISPMTLGERRFDPGETGWIYETKLQGYRVLAQCGEGQVQLKTQHGANASAWFPEVTSSLAALTGGPHVCDGEICVMDATGCGDLDRLQSRARRRAWYEGADPVVYCVFDLLMECGVDITSRPLVERKARLAILFTPLPASIRLVGHIDGDEERELMASVVPQELDRLVAKRKASMYHSGARPPDWVKLKRGVSPTPFQLLPIGRDNARQFSPATAASRARS